MEKESGGLFIFSFQLVLVSVSLCIVFFPTYLSIEPVEWWMSWIRLNLYSLFLCASVTCYKFKKKSMLHICCFVFCSHPHFDLQCYFSLSLSFSWFQNVDKYFQSFMFNHIRNVSKSIYHPPNILLSSLFLCYCLFHVHFCSGFPGGSDSKVSACNEGDLGLIPGSGRPPGEGHGSPLWYSCLENPHGQRSLAGYSPWRGHKESDTTEWLSTIFFLINAFW